jgi:hypothetical protein
MPDNKEIKQNRAPMNHVSCILLVLSSTYVVNTEFKASKIKGIHMHNPIIL